MNSSFCPILSKRHCAGQDCPRLNAVPLMADQCCIPLLCTHLYHFHLPQITKQNRLRVSINGYRNIRHPAGFLNTYLRITCKRLDQRYRLLCFSALFPAFHSNGYPTSFTFPHQNIMFKFQHLSSHLLNSLPNHFILPCNPIYNF